MGPPFFKIGGEGWRLSVRGEARDNRRLDLGVYFFVCVCRRNGSRPSRVEGRHRRRSRRPRRRVLCRRNGRLGVATATVVSRRDGSLRSEWSCDDAAESPD